jgi:predicted dehydrogenase
MVKIGVVGTGAYGRVHLNALSQRQAREGDVKLIGIAEIDEARRQQTSAEYECPGYSSHEELIETGHPDAVCVVTPDHLHYRVVMDCLKEGLPVLVEKPFATDLEQAREMAREARKRKVFLQVDFHKRFDPYHIDLKMRIAERELGDVQYGYCWIEDVLDVGRRMIGKESWQGQGSPAWFLGIHMIDLTYWMIGTPRATRVYAQGFKGKLRSMGIDIYDSVKATVTYENGVSVTYDCSVILPDSHESRVRQGVKMVGTEGVMEVNSQYRGAKECTSAKGMETPNLGGRYRTYGKDGGIVYHGYFNDSIFDFVDNLQLLRNGKTIQDLEGLYASPEQGVETTKIGVAVHESARSGEVIDLSRW